VENFERFGGKGRFSSGMGTEKMTFFGLLACEGASVSEWVEEKTRPMSLDSRGRVFIERKIADEPQPRNCYQVVKELES
jgi:hypothetical protein